MQSEAAEITLAWITAGFPPEVSGSPLETQSEPGGLPSSREVANAYMADLTDEDERKVGYARLGAASSFGFVVGQVISGLVARTDTGVTAVLVLALALSAIAALLVRFRLPAVPPRPTTSCWRLARGNPASSFECLVSAA